MATIYQMTIHGVHKCYRSMQIREETPSSISAFLFITHPHNKDTAERILFQTSFSTGETESQCANATTHCRCSIGSRNTATKHHITHTISYSFTQHSGDDLYNRNKPMGMLRKEGSSILDDRKEGETLLHLPALIIEMLQQSHQAQPSITSGQILCLFLTAYTHTHTHRPAEPHKHDDTHTHTLPENGSGGYTPKKQKRHTFSEHLLPSYYYQK